MLAHVSITLSLLFLLELSNSVPAIPVPQFRSRINYETATWSQWSAWSVCSGVQQVRIRACRAIRGYTCEGDRSQIRDCPPAKNSFRHEPSNYRLPKDNAANRFSTRYIHTRQNAPPPQNFNHRPEYQNYNNGPADLDRRWAMAQLGIQGHTWFGGKQKRPLYTQKTDSNQTEQIADNLISNINHSNISASENLTSIELIPLLEVGNVNKNSIDNDTVIIHIPADPEIDDHRVEQNFVPTATHVPILTTTAIPQDAFEYFTRGPPVDEMPEKELLMLELLGLSTESYSDNRNHHDHQHENEHEHEHESHEHSHEQSDHREHNYHSHEHGNTEIHEDNRQPLSEIEIRPSRNDRRVSHDSHELHQHQALGLENQHQTDGQNGNTESENRDSRHHREDRVNEPINQYQISPRQLPTNAPELTIFPTNHRERQPQNTNIQIDRPQSNKQRFNKNQSGFSVDIEDKRTTRVIGVVQPVTRAPIPVRNRASFEQEERERRLDNNIGILTSHLPTRAFELVTNAPKPRERNRHTLKVRPITLITAAPPTTNTQRPGTTFSPVALIGPVKEFPTSSLLDPLYPTPKFRRNRVKVAVPTSPQLDPIKAWPVRVEAYIKPPQLITVRGHSIPVPYSIKSSEQGESYEEYDESLEDRSISSDRSSLSTEITPKPVSKENSGAKNENSQNSRDRSRNQNTSEKLRALLYELKDFELVSETPAPPASPFETEYTPNHNPKYTEVDYNSNEDYIPRHSISITDEREYHGERSDEHESTTDSGNPHEWIAAQFPEQDRLAAEVESSQQLAVEEISSSELKFPAWMGRDFDESRNRHDSDDSDKPLLDWEPLEPSTLTDLGLPDVIKPQQSWAEIDFDEDSSEASFIRMAPAQPTRAIDLQDLKNIRALGQAFSQGQDPVSTADRKSPFSSWRDQAAELLGIESLPEELNDQLTNLASQLDWKSLSHPSLRDFDHDRAFRRDAYPVSSPLANAQRSSVKNNLFVDAAAVPHQFGRGNFQHQNFIGTVPNHSTSREEIKPIKGSLDMPAASETSVTQSLPITTIISTSDLPTTTTETLIPVLDERSNSASIEESHRESGKWSQWSQWSQCKRGFRWRNRVCSYTLGFMTRGCLGKSYETEECERQWTLSKLIVDDVTNVHNNPIKPPVRSFEISFNDKKVLR